MSAREEVILVVEDEPQHAKVILRMLGTEPREVKWVERLSDALELAQSVHVGAVLLDLNVGDSSGLATLIAIRRVLPDAPVIVVTGTDDEELAALAIQQGADDYIVKGRFGGETMIRSLRYSRERRRTMSSLRDAERRYREIVENVQEGIYTAGADMRLVFANQQFAVMLGYEPGELVGRDVIDFIDPSERAGFAPLMQPAEPSGEYEVLMVRKDGERIWIRALVRPMFDGNSRSKGYMATLIDITPRKVAEQQRNQSETLFQTLVEQTLVGVCIVAEDKITYSNPALERLTGYSAAELHQIAPFDLVYPDDLSIALESHEAPGTLEGSRHLRIVRKDGAIREVEFDARAAAPSGTASTIITILDVTEKRRSEAMRDHLAAIVESTEDAVITVDMDGRILSWNGAAEQLCGHSSGQAVGQLVTSILAADCDEVRQALLGATSGCEHVRHIDTRRTRPDGTEAALSIAIAPLRDVAGKVIAISAICRDVTETRMAERELQRADRHAALGHVATVIAHEFNNVLMGIQPFTEVIERLSAEPKVVRSARHIRFSIKRGGRLVENLRRFANPIEPRILPVAIEPLVARLDEEWRALCGERIALEVEIEADVSVAADATQLSQMLTNLLQNAREAMPDGGRIRLSVSNGQAGQTFSFGPLSQPEQFVRFTVTDTGSGIDPSVLPRIFDPLFTTKPASSAGLGLAVVNRLVRAHHGRIFVESSRDHGTTISMFLPRHLSAEEPAKNETTPRSSLGGRRVLIVEDEIAVAAGIAELLALEGMICEIVNEGTQAVAAVEAFAPEMVILDLTLPDIDGREVFMRIAAARPGLPVLFSTGHGLAEELRDLPRSGYVSMLQKPYEVDALLRELEQGLNASRPE